MKKKPLCPTDISPKGERKEVEVRGEKLEVRS
jgi:hypothetical protein